MAVIALVYQVLGLAHIVSPISQQELIEVVGLLINLLVLVGIVVDPTTKGIADGESTIKYDK